MSIAVAMKTYSTSRWAVLALVIAGHLGLLAAALSLRLREATSPTWVSTTTMISEAPIELTAPRLTPAMDSPDLDTHVSVVVDAPLIEEGADDTDAQHSAPVLITSVPPDALRAFAQRAGLKDDEQVTVLLRVQVLAEGTAGEVVIEKSGGTPLIDAAAVEYVRMLRWISGRRAGEPAIFFIRMGVHFAA